MFCQGIDSKTIKNMTLKVLLDILLSHKPTINWIFVTQQIGRELVEGLKTVAAKRFERSKDAVRDCGRDLQRPRRRNIC